MRRWKWTVFRETASRCSETWRTHRVRAAPWILERHAHHSSTIGRLRSCRTPRIHADFARVDLLARHFLQRVYIDFTIDGISTGRFERWNKHHKCTHAKSSDPTRNSYLAIPSPLPFYSRYFSLYLSIVHLPFKQFSSSQPNCCTRYL